MPDDVSISIAGGSTIEVAVGGQNGPTATITAGGTADVTVTSAGPAPAVAWDNVQGKPSTFPPSSHQHVVGDVTGLQAALDGKQAAGAYATLVSGKVPTDQLPPLASSWDDLTGKPSTFPPSTHNHDDRYYTESEVDTLLSGKQASGTYATLVSGTVPSSQLPSYVDDVIEAANLAALPGTGETGKIYVTVDSNKTYRWSGTTYIEVSPGPGSTDSVAEGPTNLYYTNARAAAAAPVQSVAGRTGNVTIAAADVSGLGGLATASSVAYGDLTGTPSSFAPSAHKSSHATGGADSLSPSDIGAAAEGHAHSAMDITGLATVATSGSYTDLTNKPALFDGAYSSLSGTPSTFAPSAHKSSHATGGSDALTASDIGAAASSHTHGNLTNAGAIGTTSGLPVITTTSGVLTTGAFGASSGQFCQGNDSRLSDSRTPTSHASTHQIGGADFVANVVNSPSQITSNQNDYSLPSADVVRISSDAARDITGFAAGSSGQAVMLVNVGDYTIALRHQSTSSTAANRIVVPWASDYLMDAGYSALLVYDATASRWRIV